MYSRTRNENGNLNKRCLYCFMMITSEVETEHELKRAEATHICPEKALAHLLALERTALAPIPNK